MRKTNDRKYTVHTIYVVRREKGFTLIISVLISSILLSIGLAMFNIGVKEAILSSTGRESLVSFYAADAGDECALYWEVQVPSPFDTDSPAPAITCNGTAVTVDSSSCSAGVCTHDLTYQLGASINDPCALLHIEKDTTIPSIRIEARGYNTCNTADPKRTERAIEHTL